MANYKRKSPKTKIRCAMCTPYRNGNNKESIKPKYRLIKGMLE